MSADVITLFPDATVQPLVPRPFGQRKPGYLAGGFAEVLERPEDREEIDRVKNAARAARDAMSAKPTVSRDEVVALSELLDEAAHRASVIARKSGRTAFQLVAQDAESLSERLVHLAAEVGVCDGQA